MENLTCKGLSAAHRRMLIKCCEAVLVLSHIHHDWWTGQRQDDDAKVYLGHLPGSVPVKRDPFGCTHR